MRRGVGTVLGLSLGAAITLQWPDAPRWLLALLWVVVGLCVFGLVGTSWPVLRYVDEYVLQPEGKRLRRVQRAEAEAAPQVAAIDINLRQIARKMMEPYVFVEVQLRPSTRLEDATVSILTPIQMNVRRVNAEHNATEKGTPTRGPAPAHFPPHEQNAKWCRYWISQEDLRVTTHRFYYVFTEPEPSPSGTRWAWPGFPVQVRVESEKLPDGEVIANHFLGNPDQRLGPTSWLG